MSIDRRRFIELSGLAAVGALVPAGGCGTPERAPAAGTRLAAAEHTIRIATGRVELAPGRTIVTTTYNGQVPGPLLRLKEGRPVTVDIQNDTAVPEQLHWHGQALPVDVDGSAEEGTPYIPAHGSRRITFTPGPAGLRFYHTHVRAGSDLGQGQYGGLVGPVYVEPARDPGAHDREVFLVLKEFEPTLSQGGDMALDVLAQGPPVAALRERGERAMKQSLAAGAPHGNEVGYRTFTINGRMFGAGEPVRVKAGERVLFHVVNASATEIRSLALPGHTFRVVALDGNPVPVQVEVPVLWLGTGERVSATVDMTHPGVWVLGDLSDDDREHGMGIVVEYADHSGTPRWTKPAPFKWDYTAFGAQGAPLPAPDETVELTFAKENAAEQGFNRWTINGVAFSMTERTPLVHVQHGRRYRFRLHNTSDDIHPVHLHRQSFELVSIGAKLTRGVIKDVVMLDGYHELAFDVVAQQRGLSLFHCHQQLHMDFGFMALFECS